MTRLRHATATAVAGAYGALFGIVALGIIATEPSFGPAAAVAGRLRLDLSPLALRALAVAIGALFFAVSLAWGSIMRLLIVGAPTARRGAALMVLGTALVLLPPAIKGVFGAALIALPLLTVLVVPRGAGPTAGRISVALVTAGSLASLLIATTIVG
jgi:hypothetical protein